MTATEIFRLVHATHDVIEVAAVCPTAREPVLVCLTCHEEQTPEDVAS